jgi:hypothetical protein
MIWVTWRQHRAQALACLVLLFLFAAYAVAVGTWMRSTFNADGLPACLAHSGGADCPAAITSFIDKFSRNGLGVLINLPLIAIPGLLGLVVGAPLLGQELERGTWRLAWSQTVPRTRWLAAKLGLVIGGLVLFGVAVTALMTWYHAPLDEVTSRSAPIPFNGEGLTFTASMLCAFGIGVLAGLLLRNVIAAMVVTYIGWDLLTGLVLVLGSGVPIHILPAATMRIPCADGCPGASAGSVVPVTGHLSDFVYSVTRSGGELVVSYQPASQFWTLQFIQGGIYLGVAVATLGVAVWLLNRRTT